MKDIHAPGAEGFYAWLEKWQPGLLKAAAPHLPKLQLSGLGLTVSDTPSGTSTTWDDSSMGLNTPASMSTSSGGILDGVKNALTIAAQAYLTKTQLDAQKKILDLQIARAQAGQPPLDIDPSQYGVPSVNVGMSSGTKQLVTYIAIGAGALLLLSMLRGRRS